MKINTIKLFLGLLLTLIFAALPFEARASGKKHKQVRKQQTNAASVSSTENTKANNLKKEMHFSDQVVNGKFQLPGDSAIEVENEKPVFNLLQIRADFNDRRLKETTRDQ
jgi:hypothetical protein